MPHGLTESIDLKLGVVYLLLQVSTCGVSVRRFMRECVRSCVHMCACLWVCVCVCECERERERERERQASSVSVYVFVCVVPCVSCVYVVCQQCGVSVVCVVSCVCACMWILICCSGVMADFDQHY